jgi:hypothetical protein
MDKDMELLKVKILADFYNTRLISWFSFLAAFLIALALVLTTFTFQGYIDAIDYFSLFALLAVLFGVRLVFLADSYSKTLHGLDTLISKIDKGEALPPLEKLKEDMRRSVRTKQPATDT